MAKKATAKTQQKATTKAVATTKPESKAVAKSLDFAADAGKGLEGTDKDSYALPFLAVLQGLSPQLEKVDGAKPGLIINTITNELFKEALVIPCAFQRRYIRWAAREDGGGFKGQFSPVEVETGSLEGVERNDEGRYVIEGDELKDTRHHYLLVRSASGNWQPALLSLSSTQIKKSKRWLSLIQGIELKTDSGKPYTPPSFSHVYRIKPIKEENSMGAWWGVDVEVVKPIEEADVYRRAKAFHDSVVAGEVEATAPPMDVDADDGF